MINNNMDEINLLMDKKLLSGDIVDMVLANNIIKFSIPSVFKKDIVCPQNSDRKR